LANRIFAFFLVAFALRVEDMEFPFESAFVQLLFLELLNGVLEAKG
jgi:hypothetical protein